MTTPGELEGVIAHEMSHVAHKDLPGARVTHSCDSLIKISRDPGRRHHRLLPDQARRAIRLAARHLRM